MTPNNEETKKKIVDTSQKIQVCNLSENYVHAFLCFNKTATIKTYFLIKCNH